MSDEIDDLIRRRLQASIPLHADGLNALGAAKPSMARARRQRQLQTGLASVALLAVVGVGSLVTIFRDGSSDRTVIADVPDVPTASTSSVPPTTADLAVPPPLITTTAPPPPVDGSTNTTDFNDAEPQEPDTTTVDAGDEDTGGDGNEVSPSTSDDDAPTTTVADSSDDTADSTSQTSTPTSTIDSETTSTGAPTTASTGDQTLESECGTIEIDVDGSTVTLVATNPAPGYEADVKDDGPDSIEVHFEGPKDCSISAEFEGSELEVEYSD